MHGATSASIATTRCCARRSCGTTAAPSAECAEIEAAFPARPRGRRQHRHAGLHRAQARLAAQARAGGLRQRIDTRAAAQGLRPPAPDRRPRLRDVRRRRAPSGSTSAPATGRTICWRPPASSRSQMPRLVEGSAASGELLPELAARWGIDGPVVVAGGAGDNAAAACGVGVVPPGIGLRLDRHLGRALRLQRRLLAQHRRRGARLLPRHPDTWHQMGVILSASDSLEWLAAHRRPHGRRRSPPPSAAGRRRPRTSPFLPYLSGERTPHNDAAARGAFVGLVAIERPRDLTQAVLEGVAYAFADCQRRAEGRRHRLRSRAGRRRRRALATPGSAIIASVLDRPLEIAADSDVGAALGAARLAICAAEGADPAEVCAAPEIAARHRARSGARARATCEGYARYRALYPALKETRAMSDFFAGIDPVPFKGPDSDDPMAFRFYEPDRMVLGKRMEDHLRMAVAYWHSFAWPGSDPFGGQTFERPWFGERHGGRDAQGRGRLRDVRHPRRASSSRFHDRDIAPEGKSLARIQPQRQRDRRVLRPPHGRDRRRAALGHRQPLLATAASWPAPPPTPIRRSSPTPPRR